MRPIIEVAEQLGIEESHLTQHGKWKAKVSLKTLDESRLGRNRGKLVLVSAMTPTPFGEGKTVTSIGLAMGLQRIGRSSVVCLRQPSLGPVFGMKGGAAGGGRAVVEPMQEINMRFTGDIDAVGTAHNLLAAMIDNHIFQGNDLSIDPTRIAWLRAIDMNDRALRRTIVAVGSKSGVERDDGFLITAASEVMAVLCLSESYSDLKKRLGRIIVGYDRSGRSVCASQLKAGGAMAATLRDAMQPNLAQTAEGTPALIHGGPFGNIAHGTASLTSIELGLRLAEFCVVEAGFATDLGAEKFVDIVSQIGGFNVDVAIVVASIRALKHHGVGSAGDAPKSAATALALGLENLRKHIENIRSLGIEPVVAINKFRTDAEDELKEVEQFCSTENVSWSISSAYEDGGNGSIELAQRVVESSAKGFKSRPIYSASDTLEAKLNAITRKIYGGVGVEYSESAREDIKRIEALGLEGSPVCVAKTQLSLSDDPHKLGKPSDFLVRVRKIEPAAGAGFNIAYMGDVVTMPGLPKHPAAENISLTDDGVITGLF